MIDMNFTEKRKFSRLNSRIPVQYKMMTEYKDALQGSVTADIGEGGIRFVAYEFIPLSVKLKVEIFFPPLSNSISAVSRVAWIRKLSCADRYDVGLEFTDLPDSNRRLIASYITRKA